jgi:MFS family permease
LFAAQSLGSAATVAIFPIIAIVGAKLSGRPAWAGVPAASYLSGQALGAYVWGEIMDRIGRRGALGLGMLVGAVGAAIAAVGIVGRSFSLFLVGSVTVGLAISAVQLSRFVAAEVHMPAERARAISTVVLGGTVGAILGPLLAGPMSRLARGVGLEELAGPYGATMALFVIGAVVVLLWLRPEPRDFGRMIAVEGGTHSAAAGHARRISEILQERPAQVAVSAMVFGQLVMSMLMVITPLHMRGHQHAISSISFVISAHVVGMYAFSVISGQLADRWGRGPVIMGGGTVLILACLAVTLPPQVLPLSIALFLLGLGWNLCYVGGSSLLADQLSPQERARTQGFNDLLIGLSSAAGGLGSGIVFAAIGYDAMGLVGAATALVPLTMAAAWRSRAVAVAP